jgi:GrpB-like predicted nucleotidyltransferase (UPF0157 family)
MFEQHSLEWERRLRFRDRLLVSALLAAQYAELKLVLVGEAPAERDRYQRLKGSFIDRVLCP